MNEIDYTQRIVQRSAADALSVSWRWMVDVLFKPFKLKKWCLLGLIAFIMGLSGFFAQGPNIFLQLGRMSFHKAVRPFLGEKILPMIPVIILGGLVLFVVVLVLMYIGVRFHFIYLYSIAQNKIQIRRGWHNLGRQANSFFGWMILLTLAGVCAFIVIFVVMIACIFLIIPFVLLGIPLALAFPVCALYIQSIIVPIMYVKRVNFLEAYRISRQFWKKNINQIALFLLLNYGIGIAIVPAALIMLVIILGIFSLPVILIIALTTGFHNLTFAAILPWLPLLIAYFFLADYCIIVALQPISVFMQSFNMAFVEGFGVDFRMLGVQDVEPFDYNGMQAI